jgi:hypothetical protein
MFDQEEREKKKKKRMFPNHETQKPFKAKPQEVERE